MYGNKLTTVFRTCLFLPLINIRRCLLCLPLKREFPQWLKSSFIDLTHRSHPALCPCHLPTQPPHIHYILPQFCFQLSYVFKHMHVRIDFSENTHILSLSLMDEEMLAQTHKQKPPSLFFELHESFGALTYLAAPPSSYPLFLSPRLGPYLIVCLFSLVAPYFRSQARRREVGAQPTT